MRGEVQIWAGDELLHQEPNLIVDGAGEVLADIIRESVKPAVKLLGENFSPVPSGANTVVTGISPTSSDLIDTPNELFPNLTAAPANNTDISAKCERCEKVVSRLLVALAIPAGFQYAAPTPVAVATAPPPVR